MYKFSIFWISNKKYTLQNCKYFNKLIIFVCLLEQKLMFERYF